MSQQIDSMAALLIRGIQRSQFLANVLPLPERGLVVREVVAQARIATKEIPMLLRSKQREMFRLSMEIDQTLAEFAKHPDSDRSAIDASDASSLATQFASQRQRVGVVE